MPDITNNPDVVRLIRELNRLGAKAMFYRSNARYGYLLVLLRPALVKIVEDMNRRWAADVAELKYMTDTGVAVFTIHYHDNHVVTQEDKDYIINTLRTHGVLADVVQTAPDTVNVLVHVETYAKYIEKNIVRRLHNANAYVQYVRETAALVIHMWTGTRPSQFASPE